MVAAAAAAPSTKPAATGSAAGSPSLFSSLSPRYLQKNPIKTNDQPEVGCFCSSSSLDKKKKSKKVVDSFSKTNLPFSSSSSSSSSSFFEKKKKRSNKLFPATGTSAGDGSRASAASSSSALDPLDVVKRVRDLCETRLKVVDGDDPLSAEAQRNATPLTCCLLRSTLAAKRVLRKEID